MRCRSFGRAAEDYNQTRVHQNTPDRRMLNPYAPPEPQSLERPRVQGRDEASLIWVAVVVTPVLLAHFFYLKFGGGDIQEIGLINVLFELLRAISPSVVLAILVYAAARHVVRQRFDYSSTRRSLICISILASPYLMLLRHWWWNRTFGDNVWFVGFAMGLAVAIGLAVLDLGLAQTPFFSARESASIRTSRQHASVFWFVAGIMPIVAFIGLMNGGFRAPSMDRSQLEGMFELASTLCLFSTCPYLLCSALVPRRSHASVTSRLAAAFTYIVVFMLLTTVVRPATFDPWISQLLIPVLMLTPAALAVIADRIVSRRWATVSET